MRGDVMLNRRDVLRSGAALPALSLAGLPFATASAAVVRSGERALAFVAKCLE
jgi:hypothetical protein